jgi:tetratricopeptide (TPR) repeat protein
LYFNKARALFELGHKVEAEALFKRAYMLNPTNEDVHFYLGVFYKNTKDYQQAVLWLLSSLDINNDQPEAHNLLGLVYYLSHQDDKALQEFELALQYDSDFLDAVRNKGLIFQGQRRYDEASPLYKQVLDRQPTDTEVLLDLVHCYYKLGELDSCILYLKQALKVEPDNKKALRLLMVIDQKLNL